MHLLKDIFTFAWRGSGKYVMIICVALSVVSDLASLSPLFGGIATLFLSGYFCAIFYQMIQSTATGGREAPEFPDTSDIFEDIIWPMLQTTAVIAAAFGPYLIHYFLVDERTSHSPISLALLGFGIIYFPMAMLAVIILGYTGAMSPHIVMPALWRGGGTYWFGVILLLILYGISEWIDTMFSGQIIVGHLIMAVVGSYTLMTNARILGLVYREKQEELGWL